MMNGHFKDAEESKEFEKETLIKSTEETVCSPEFPDGCIDVEQ
ncbi:hypothetical protein [Scatolibacter rhodanostii]|nr:hypothetical protein [Scatolibacter rhodanostii]